jgi:hypothetical protein
VRFKDIPDDFFVKPAAIAEELWHVAADVDPAAQVRIKPLASCFDGLLYYLLSGAGYG